MAKKGQTKKADSSFIKLQARPNFREQSDKEGGEGNRQEAVPCQESRSSKKTKGQSGQQKKENKKPHDSNGQEVRPQEPHGSHDFGARL